MKNDVLKEMHDAEGREKIKKLEEKIETTEYNIEVSKELISGVPSDTQRDKLREKNTQRKHAVGSMKKEIRDIEQTMEQRGVLVPYII